MDGDWIVVPESIEDLPEPDEGFREKQRRREAERARWQPFRDSLQELRAESIEKNSHKNRVGQEWRSSHKNRTYRFDEDKGWEGM